MKSVGSQTPKHTCVLSVHSPAWLVMRGLQGTLGQGDFWWQCRRDRGIQWTHPVTKDQRGNKFIWNRENWQWPLPSECQLWELLSSNWCHRQQKMNPLPETLKVWNDEPGQAGESEPWDVCEEQKETTIPRLCGRASHTPRDGLQGWEAAAQEHQGPCCPNPTAGACKTLLTARTSLPLWISHHLCQSTHLIYCLCDAGARAAAGGCELCSWLQNPSKVKPFWTCAKHSGSPEHSTHRLWAF